MAFSIPDMKVHAIVHATCGGIFLKPVQNPETLHTDTYGTQVSPSNPRISVIESYP